VGGNRRLTACAFESRRKREIIGDMVGANPLRFLIQGHDGFCCVQLSISQNFLEFARFLRAAGGQCFSGHFSLGSPPGKVEAGSPRSIWWAGEGRPDWAGSNGTEASDWSHRQGAARRLWLYGGMQVSCRSVFSATGCHRCVASTCGCILKIVALPFELFLEWPVT
jgi:hypothetical protein